MKQSTADVEFLYRFAIACDLGALQVWPKQARMPVLPGCTHLQTAIGIKSALADGDRVAVFSHVKQNSQDRGVAVVHIFRFEGNQIVELWDVGQLISEDSPNENGPF